MKNTATYALSKLFTAILSLAILQTTSALENGNPSVYTTCRKKLETWEELENPLRFPDSATSLLSKHLTPEIWDTLKDKKDAHGFTFKQAVFSGCKNTDSGIGVYAGS